jgi:hypothetical protein
MNASDQNKSTESHLDSDSTAVSQVIETSSAKLFLRKDGIIQVDGRPNAELNLAAAIDAVAAQAVLAAGKKRPLLVNMGLVKSMDRNARVYFAGAEAERNVTAAALVISSMIGRVIGNFFIGLNKSLFPTRLFVSQEEAIAWLRGYL